MNHKKPNVNGDIKHGKYVKHSAPFAGLHRYMEALALNGNNKIIKKDIASFKYFCIFNRWSAINTGTITVE